MSVENTIDFAVDSEHVDMAKRVMVLVLARKIYAGDIKPDEITSAEQFILVIQQLGRAHEDAFEFNVDDIESDVQLIRHCIEQEKYHSAIVLLFTLLEREINTIIRTLLRIRGMSHGTISDALKGTDFATKLDVLLLLLEAEPPPRFRQVALQCKTIRNLVVHNKATPSMFADVGNRQSDHEVATTRAREFFGLHNIGKIEADIRDYFDSSVGLSTEVQQAWALLDRFQPTQVQHNW